MVASREFADAKRYSALKVPTLLKVVGIGAGLIVVLLVAVVLIIKKLSRAVAEVEDDIPPRR